MDKLNEILNVIPFKILLVLWLGWLGYQYYINHSDPSSQLLMKKGELTAAQGEEEKAKKKIADALAFRKSLEAERVRIRNLNSELKSMQSTLTEQINVPDVVNTLTNEAKKVNLKILSFVPGKENHKELYSEQPIELELRGVFHQVVVFFEKISTLKDIMRIGNFNLNSLGTGDERFVELKGKMTVLVYRYVRSEQEKDGTNKPNLLPGAKAPGGTP